MQASGNLPINNCPKQLALSLPLFGVIDLQHKQFKVTSRTRHKDILDPKVMSSYFSLKMLRQNLTINLEFLRNYIRKLNRTEIVFLCAKLNLIISDSSDGDFFENQGIVLKLLEQDSYVDKVMAARVTKVIKDRSRHVNWAFNRPQLMDMIWRTCVWANDNISMSKHKSSDDVQKALIYALLMCSDLYGERFSTYFGAEVGSPISSWFKTPAFAALPAYRIMAEYSPRTVPVLLPLGRARLLIMNRLLVKHPKYERAFSKKYGLTMSQYITCAAAVTLVGVTQPLQNKLELDSLDSVMEFDTNNTFILAPHMVSPYQAYLACKAQSVNNLSEAFTQNASSGVNAFLDWKPLRDRPILCTESGRAIVLDKFLLADSVSVGPLFMLSGEDSQVLSDFGSAHEDYACEVLESYVTHIPKQNKPDVTTRQPKAKGSSGPVEIGDYLLSKGKEVVLIEAKASWLTDETLMGARAGKLWAYIHEKYGYSWNKKANEARTKGVAQLVKKILQLVEGDLQPQGNTVCLKEANTIYPVLLVHDDRMCTPNFGHFLARDFVRLATKPAIPIPESGFLQLGQYKVHTLFVISLGELEALEARKNPDSLTNYLAEFSQLDPMRNSSFTLYLRTKQLEWCKPAESMLYKATFEMMDEVSQMCFKQPIKFPEDKA